MKLLKLTPVADLEKNVFFLSNFVDADDLMARVDLPLGVATDSKVDKPFLTCDYNRDEDSFRCVAWRVVPRRGRQRSVAWARRAGCVRFGPHVLRSMSAWLTCVCLGNLIALSHPA